MKLWTLLQTHYAHQNFNKKMGLVGEEIAKLWRHEFQKNGIAFDEIVFIGNNLGELTNPTFIPNVFELITIVKSDKERKIAHERVTRALPYIMTAEQTRELRERTEKIRTSSISKMSEIFNAP